MQNVSAHLYTPRRRNTSVLSTDATLSAASVCRMMRQARGAHAPNGALSARRDTMLLPRSHA